MRMESPRFSIIYIVPGTLYQYSILYSILPGTGSTTVATASARNYATPEVPGTGIDTWYCIGTVYLV